MSLPQRFAATSVRVSVTIATASKDISVVLERLETKSDPQILGELRDDGQGGDVSAGDRIFSTTILIEEKKTRFVNLRASAKISGNTVQSPVFELAVLPKGAPVRAVGDSGLNNVARDPKTGAKFTADMVHVCFDRKVAYEKILTLANAISGKVVGRFSEIGNCYQLKIPSSKDGSTVLAAIAKIKSTPGVLSAEPNRIFQLK